MVALVELGDAGKDAPPDKINALKHNWPGFADSVVMTAKRRTGRYPALSGQQTGTLEVTMGVHNEGKSGGVRY